MTYLQLVQRAMKRAGVREDSPSTLVGATGIVEDFKDYVADTYRKIQNTEHAESWFFRQSLDQTFTVNASDDDYPIPTGLQDINWRTVTIYETAKTDEAQLKYTDYYAWRMHMDTRTVEETRPSYITISPDDTIYLYPVPDKEYTLRFDGILELDELSADADEPIIPARYQWCIVWGAVMRFAKHHEDGAKYADAEDEFKPVYDTLVERQLPETHVITGHLYGERKQYGR